MSEHVIQILGVASGQPSPVDGHYLVEYDPDRRGVAPDGTEMYCHLVTSPNVGEAKRYISASLAMAEWKRVSRRWPTRPNDGKPNRPLSAFTVAVVRVA